MTLQDRKMYYCGFVRSSLVAEALGVGLSTVIRRCRRGRYGSMKAGRMLYVKLETVYRRVDTNPHQLEGLKAMLATVERTVKEKRGNA